MTTFETKEVVFTHSPEQSSQETTPPPEIQQTYLNCYRALLNSTLSQRVSEGLWIKTEEILAVINLPPKDLSGKILDWNAYGLVGIK